MFADDTLVRTPLTSHKSALYSNLFFQILASYGVTDTTKINWKPLLPWNHKYLFMAISLFALWVCGESNGAELSLSCGPQLQSAPA